MKRVVVLFVLIVAGFSYSQAQRYKVTSAWNNLRKNNLKDALEAIEPAKDHKRTKDDAKTWFYRGNIYLAIHMSKKDKFKNLVEGGLDSAYVSYKKAVELDEKDKYKEKLTDRMKYVSEQYFNQGVNNYKTKKYDVAMMGFERAAMVNKKYRNEIDTAAYYYAGNSADLAGDKEKALKYYKKAKEYKFDNPRIYSSLSRLYSTKGDTAKAFEVVKQGKKRYPDNYDLTITVTNLYISKGETEKALDNLKVAVKQDPKNPELWFAAGVNYENMMKEIEDTTIKNLTNKIQYKVRASTPGFKVTYKNTQGNTEQKSVDEFYWNKILEANEGQNYYVSAQANNKKTRIVSKILFEDYLLEQAKSDGDYVVAQTSTTFDKSSIKSSSKTSSTISMKEKFMEEAINSYKNAIELDDKYFKPAFNLGAIFVNRAAVLQNRANQLPLDATEKFNKIKKRADSMLKQAMPHLENAHQIKPQDLNTLQSLKEIYARLNKTEKLKEVNGKIQQLTGGAAKGKNE